MTKKVLAKANPNHHGWLKLVEETSDWTGETVTEWYVREPNSTDRDDIVELETLAEAQAYYDERLTFWSKEPNWEAQARYDEQWGTDNGYGRHQVGREY